MQSNAYITEYLSDLIEWGYMYHVRERALKSGCIPMYRKECPIEHCRGSKRVDFALYEYNENTNNYDIICMEIKSGYADFASTHGRNFVGNENYIVVMKKDEKLAMELCDTLYPHVGIICVHGELGGAFVDECNFEWYLVREAKYIQSTNLKAIKDFIYKKGGYVYIPDSDRFDKECDSKCKSGEEEVKLYEAISEKYVDIMSKKMENKYRNMCKIAMAI